MMPKHCRILAILLLSVGSGCYSQGRFCLREWSIETNRFGRPALTSDCRHHLPLDSFATANLHWQYNVPYDFCGYHPGGGRFRDRQASLNRMAAAMDTWPEPAASNGTDGSAPQDNHAPAEGFVGESLNRPIGYVSEYAPTATVSRDLGAAPAGTWVFTGARSSAD